MKITEWLEGSIHFHGVIATPADDEMDFAILAWALRAEAQYAGFSVEALEAAWGGDIPAHLMANAHVVNLDGRWGTT